MKNIKHQTSKSKINPKAQSPTSKFGIWKFVVGICLAVGILLLGFSVLMVGCGKQGSGSSTSGYTILGIVPNSQTQALSIGAKATAVTHIVAVDSNGQKTQATLSSNGSFSVPVTKGYPYALGFYNKSGTVITLLGYLKQKDVNWDSLPLMNPSGSSTDLGTVTVEATSQEAIPSINLTTLINQMSMVDQTTASYYGQIDGPMAVLTNVDVDGNGVFDFEENKSYLFWADMQFTTTSEIQSMLTDYADYIPTVASYVYQFIFTEGGQSTAGRRATMTPPGTTLASQTGDAAANRTEWVFSFGAGLASPTAPPSGTYTIEVTGGVGTYRLQNFQPSQISYVGATNDIIYPVLKITTDEAGYITRISHQWKIRKSGVARNATAEEIKTVEDTQVNTSRGFSHSSPFFSFNFSDGASTSPLNFYRDNSYTDITTVTIDDTASSSRRVLYSDVTLISVTYNLTSRTVHRFWFSK
ncbi:hypothetical protein A2276_01835 [candidate division WOR-1 bacterium RIFOXYA12_FULL_43_27]|uniref:Uncharacterized protein n=1 Tax=candidate division WOR-1 bacterium RIFOXYC2_FULL_46_14 TaxID=1802587 RepID=A0A1F4U6Q9_UNCSA|nr:MAG: hypothetical protein A2276_01835 [candidate division WOR-1 bacterium RIFOXYA12_FULL_43_27]OGC19535.1 MAG: hypothetical protein A2292_02495 [candidate division WOR-1 bacterium RIFOXYB2_FULL_46_45]OGC30523.1 MAG: hypothetical protein A2232_02495 [candidate division WOR-1 bacterium RIFOXYA2_FULL_46_56]OGC40591.1 MAG: hypothetical protein A2438_06210 [candidate division WOR-1 bacterium RIFOXYC2_FULL_46_14]